MGHTRLGYLPKTKSWTSVIGLLEEGARTADLAAATLKASERKLKEASDDLGLQYSYWLLTQLPQAARERDFVGQLRDLDFEIPDNPGFFDFLAAFSRAVDSRIDRERAHSDVGEIAQSAAAETLTALCGQEIGSLFGTETSELREALKRFSNPKYFRSLSTEFFSRFTRRYLTYFLSMELSNHVGGDRRFADINEHVEFNREFDLHIRQTAKIVEKFSEDWYSKNIRAGEISLQEASKFIYVALQKIRRDLKRGGAADG